MLCPLDPVFGFSFISEGLCMNPDAVPNRGHNPDYISVPCLAFVQFLDRLDFVFCEFHNISLKNKIIMPECFQAVNNYLSIIFQAFKGDYLHRAT